MAKTPVKDVVVAIPARLKTLTAAQKAALKKELKVDLANVLTSGGSILAFNIKIINTRPKPGPGGGTGKSSKGSGKVAGKASRK